MVIDTSAILAIHFNEPTAAWVVAQMSSTGRVLMSTVNLAEALMRLRDAQPAKFDQLEADILASSIEFVSPDVSQTKVASRARNQYPLNFGDCFAYALAKSTGLPLLTLDADFRKTDILVVSP